MSHRVTFWDQDEELIEQVSQSVRVWPVCSTKEAPCQLDLKMPKFLHMQGL